VSGFSADWLALREPVDHRSRDPSMVRDLARALECRQPTRIVDLGCGTGSNLRALAPRLGPEQVWLLVDHDPALLDAARAKLSAWAERAEEEDGGLQLEKAGKRLSVSFHPADLTEADLDGVIGPGQDLVTAAALFDLVSPAFIERFATGVAAHRAVFYTALSYDGVERWEPPHPADAAMLEVFHAHQAGDKGFGPAAGPRATRLLADAFAAADYKVQIAESPWRLISGDAELIATLAEGAASAVRETGLLPEATIAAWLAARRTASRCYIGHQDLLALPA
jgi:SAM-dependent methyltransferase